MSHQKLSNTVYLDEMSDAQQAIFTDFNVIFITQYVYKTMMKALLEHNNKPHVQTRKRSDGWSDAFVKWLSGQTSEPEVSVRVQVRTIE